MLGSWWGRGQGVVGCFLFQLPLQEKKHCMFSYTKNEFSFNTCLQELGIYLKDQRKLVPLYSGMKEMSGIFVHRAAICKYVPINPQYHGCFHQIPLISTLFYMK